MPPQTKMTQISFAPFGTTPDGTPVQIFTLRNTKGMEARISNYGGLIVSLKVPDKKGQLGDVVLGYDNLDGYIKKSPFFGVIVGRYANRIGNGKFELDGKTYSLFVNNGPNSLHGGKVGFDKKVWTPKTILTSEGPALELKYLSKDGEEGYPGNLNVTAIYRVTEQNELRLELSATTDKKTVLNLTQHTYFNLAGSGDVLKHEVTINADKFTPVDANLIPTGELKPVAGTPFDFSKPTAIGARIDNDDGQLKLGQGYDHNYVLDKPPGKLGVAARIHEPTSGRVLEVMTSEPGVQFYTANHLDGSITGKEGRVYAKRTGFCFEPQRFPDTPNKPNFPTAVLKPGEVYQHTIVYHFSTH